MRRSLFTFAVFAIFAHVHLVHATGPLAFQVGGSVTKMSREVCALKAVEAMGAKESFIFAEITPEGDALGWNENTVVLVASLPVEDTLWFGVFVVSRDNKDAERFRNAIRDHILTGSHDPTTPKRIEHPDASRKPVGLAVKWGVERHAFTPTLRFFNPGAQIVFERNKFSAQESGPGLVFGGRLEGMASAFMIKPPLDPQGFVGVVVVTDEASEAERLQQTLLAGIGKLFFD